MGGGLWPRERDRTGAWGRGSRLLWLRIVWKPLVPLRYLLNAIGTCGYLLSRRPRAVIVTNPPIFPGLIALLYCAVTKAPLVLDSHPSAFGDAPMAKQVAGIHAAHPAGGDDYRHGPGIGEDRAVRGGEADIVHEAPPAHRPLPPARSRAGRASCMSGGSPAMNRPRR